MVDRGTTRRRRAHARPSPSHPVAVQSPLNRGAPADEPPGEMSTAHEKGFWVAVLFGMPEVPAIGYWQRGGGVAPLDCDEERMAPDELAGCKALVRAHGSFAARHGARFQSHYFVSPTGISVERSGVLTPVVGAQVAFKPAGQGLRVEATLPPKALPRTQQAPLSSFHAYVRGGGPSPDTLRAGGAGEGVEGVERREGAVEELQGGEHWTYLR